MTQDNQTNSNTAHLTIQDHCAVITLDNPPVNGLGMELRQSVSAHLSWAQSNEHIESVILIGAHGVFCAGADIRQMNTPKYWTSPRTIELAAQIDTMTKPVVALLSGIAMGGGLELSLGCHYRIAMEDTKIAQPEIKLGLLPGGGGILRLPRLLGLENAIEMLLNGETINGQQALDIGLVDEVLTKESFDELLSKGLAFVKEKLRSAAPLRRTRDMALDLEQASLILERYRRQLKPNAGMAPRVILDCIQACLNTTFEDGVRLSNEATQELMQSSESAALRHLFFIQRQAIKLPPQETRSHSSPTQINGSIIKLQVFGQTNTNTLQITKTETFSPQVRDHDFNARITKSNDTLALRLYPNSELVEVVCPDDLKANDLLTQVLDWLKKNKRIPVISQSWDQALVTPLTKALGRLTIQLGEDSRLQQNHALTQALESWGLQEFMNYVNTSPLLAKETRTLPPNISTEILKPENIVQHVLTSFATVSQLLIDQKHIGDTTGLDLIAVYEMGFPRIKGGPNYCHSLSKVS
jgi:enoyl-CoA hydratase/carnithine racemase